MQTKPENEPSPARPLQDVGVTRIVFWGLGPDWVTSRKGPPQTTNQGTDAVGSGCQGRAWQRSWDQEATSEAEA